MNTFELEAELESALINNADLMSVLPRGEDSICHYVAPATNSYPIVVYLPISDVPALSGDNRELVHCVTIKICVMVSQKRFKVEEQNFKMACKFVKEIVTGLNYTRCQTTSGVEDDKLIVAYEFSKNIICLEE